MIDMDDFFDTIIQSILIGFWASMMFSSLMFVFTDSGNEKWFSRLAIGLVSLGFLGIIRKLK